MSGIDPHKRLIGEKALCWIENDHSHTKSIPGSNGTGSGFTRMHSWSYTTILGTRSRIKHTCRSCLAPSPEAHVVADSLQEPSRSCWLIDTASKLAGANNFPRPPVNWHGKPSRSIGGDPRGPVARTSAMAPNRPATFSPHTVLSPRDTCVTPNHSHRAVDGRVVKLSAGICPLFYHQEDCERDNLPSHIPACLAAVGHQNG